jgi:urease accessory protein
MVHMHRAFSFDDTASVERWAQLLHALRETSELLAEERNMGEALAKLLIDLGHARAEPWRRHPARSFSILFALAAVEWGIDADDAVTGYLWSLCEGQVSAAVRLVPLGQTDGQRMVGRLCEQIPDWVAAAKTSDEDDVGGFLPGLSMVSALHEQQYARLFRS